MQPLYNSHPRDSMQVAVVGRCQLWRGQSYSKTALWGYRKLAVVKRWLLLRGNCSWRFHCICSWFMAVDSMLWVKSLESDVNTSQIYYLYIVKSFLCLQVFFLQNSERRQQCIKQKKEIFQDCSLKKGIINSSFSS